MEKLSEKCFYWQKNGKTDRKMFFLAVLIPNCRFSPDPVKDVTYFDTIDYGLDKSSPPYEEGVDAASADGVVL